MLHCVSMQDYGELEASSTALVTMPKDQTIACVAHLATFPSDKRNRLT